MSDVLHDLNQNVLQLITLSTEMMQQHMQQQNQLITTLLERLCPSDHTQASSQAPNNTAPVQSSPDYSVTENPETAQNTNNIANDTSDTPQNILSLPKPIAESIPRADHSKCQRYLAQLSIKQQKDLFAVFIDMLERDKVRLPSHLFKGLAKRAKYNRLNVPVARPTSANSYMQPSQAAAPYPVPPPKEPETAAQTAQREAEEAREEEHDLRQMLHINSAIQGITPEALAEKLQLSHLLPV